MIYASDLFANFFDISTGLSPEVISSLMVMGIILILCIIISIRAHFADPLKKPKGILFLAETGVKFFFCELFLRKILVCLKIQDLKKGLLYVILSAETRGQTKLKVLWSILSEVRHRLANR